MSDFAYLYYPDVFQAPRDVFMTAMLYECSKGVSLSEEGGRLRETGG